MSKEEQYEEMDKILSFLKINRTGFIPSILNGKDTPFPKRETDEYFKFIKLERELLKLRLVKEIHSKDQNFGRVGRIYALLQLDEAGKDLVFDNKSVKDYLEELQQENLMIAILKA